jgi:predicted nuclease with TOPRIM domain
MASVFEALSVPRAEVARLSDGKDLQDLHSKSSLIWAVLRCHRIMQQFIEVKFRGHPAIVKEMTLFMLTERVDPSEISNLIDRVRDAESKAAQALKTTLTLEKEVSTLKRGYDNLVNNVKQLKTKLK